MLKRKKQRMISLCLCLSVIFIFTACNSKEAITKPANDNITQTPKEEDISSSSENEDEKNQEEKNVDETNNTDINETELNTEINEPAEAIEQEITETEPPILDNFSKMDDYLKDYSFDISYNDKVVTYERTYQFRGEYDLDGDGSLDNIDGVIDTQSGKTSYIDINGGKVEFHSDSPTGELYVIDMNRDDKLTEIAIFDDGPSGDPHLKLFGYDGKEAYQVGTIDRSAWMDGQGKFISWFHRTNNFEPMFYSAWVEMNKNELVTSNHDITEYIGKTYQIDGTPFFIPLDEYPENYFQYVRWEQDALREFKDTKVKILDIYMNEYDPTLNWFYVELPEGEKGLLYFWIGD